MAQNGNDHNNLTPCLQCFNEKRNAIRKIDKRDLQNIPYESPRDLVQMLVREADMNYKTIKLFEKQFKMKWNTNTGDPGQFSFHGFCKDVYLAAGKNVRTPGTRKAHVLSKLYHAQEELHKIRHLSYKELCPPVYVYKHPKWTKWEWDKTRGVNKFVEDQNDADIEWITNEKMRGYIQQYSIRNVDPNKEEGHLYWAVLEEDDIEEDDIEEAGIQQYNSEEHGTQKYNSEEDGIQQCNSEESAKEDEPSGENETEYYDHISSKLDEDDEDDEDDEYASQYFDELVKNVSTDNLGKTQVYVGRAEKGIRKRWVEDTSSHCKNMELARNVMCNMMNYDPETLKGLQLVDLRFLLHKANNLEGDNCGLFLMSLYQDATLSESEAEDIEGVEMGGWTLEPLNMLYGMNCKRGNSKGEKSKKTLKRVKQENS